MTEKTAVHTPTKEEYDRLWNYVENLWSSQILGQSVAEKKKMMYNEIVPIMRKEMKLCIELYINSLYGGKNNEDRILKFQSFEKMCKENYGKSIIVANLQVLGDTIEELQYNIELATIRNGCDIFITKGNIKIGAYIASS